MKKFDGIFFATDLDGTLLRADKTISDENKRAIEYFMSEGGRFTFVTGRIAMATENIIKQLKPNSPIGCSNGGAVYDFEKGKLLWTVTLPDSVMEMVEYVDKNLPPVGIEIVTHQNIFFYKKSSSTEKHRINEKLPDLVCDAEGHKGDIAKILFADENEANIEKLAKLLNSHSRADEFEFVRSDPEYYEILPKGISKAAAFTKISEMIGVDINKTIAIGDNENDAAMLEVAGMGFAVANASEEAKSAADRITVSNEEHAIAEIIKELDKKGKDFFKCKMQSAKCKMNILTEHTK